MLNSQVVFYVPCQSSLPRLYLYAQAHDFAPANTIPNVTDAMTMTKNSAQTSVDFLPCRQLSICDHIQCASH